MVKNAFRNVISAVIILGALFCAFALTPVEKHGWLRTEGGYLLNEKGNIVQLKGMSFFWSRADWYQGASMDYFYSKATVDFLVDSWKCSVLRVAYACDGGNCQGWSQVKTVIDAALAKGIYVIIDWHAHDAHSHSNQAIQFFTEQANLYKDKPNVIFEPYNEPIVAGDATPEDGSIVNARLTWKAIKPYLTNVTRAIRATGSKNLVILGTPYYCQHVGVAAEDPVTDNGKPFENVAYAFHFYAASHGSKAMFVKTEGGGLEDLYLKNALGLIPIFITEWGTSHSDGGLNHSEIDEENTKWWIDNFMDGKYHLGSCNWSVSNWQASSAFADGRNPSRSGQIVKAYLAKTEDEFIPDWKAGLQGPARDTTFNFPTTHPAARYNKYYGSHVEAFSVGYKNWDKVDGRADIVNNTALKVTPATGENWVSYNVKSSEALKILKIRYLAANGSGKIEIYVDDTKKADVEINKNSLWATIELKDFNMPSGDHTIKYKFINTSDDGYLIGWFELTNSATALVTPKSFNHNSSARFFNSRNGFYVELPLFHGFKSYSLVGIDGRVVKNGMIDKQSSKITFNGLINGMWILRLEGAGATKTYKTIVRDL
jgi:endoglucanase